MLSGLSNLSLLAQMQGPAVDTTSGWVKLLEGIDADKRFVLLIIAIGCSIPIVLGGLGMITATIDAIHRRRTETDLKRDMIERGLSADEIAQVVEASAPQDSAKKC